MSLQSQSQRKTCTQQLVKLRTAVDPKLECSESDDLIGQTTRESGDERVGDMPAAAKPSQRDSAVEVQGSKEGGDGEQQSGEGSKAAAVEAVEASSPLIFHSPSKKPKRQLHSCILHEYQ